MFPASSLELLQQQVVECCRCPRLVQHCRNVAATKRRAYHDQIYWGKPVPSFGDPQARLLVLGLAPGAHGANRTGRMFTGDSSGEFLYRALHETGFASQPTSRHAGDGLTLRDCWITASAHCAPPDNRPTSSELSACRPYLENELALMTEVRVVVALGRIAFDAYLCIMRDRNVIRSRAPFLFGHNSLHQLGVGLPALISSYHPSQQNTSTGKLTASMLLAVFEAARSIIASSRQGVD